MDPELHENHVKVTLDTIRRLHRRNSIVTLYKLVPKTHPAEDEDILLKSYCHGSYHWNEICIVCMQWTIIQTVVIVM